MQKISSLPTALVSQIIAHKNAINSSTFQVDVDYNGKQHIVMNPNSVFVLSITRSIKKLCDCLHQYTLYLKYMHKPCDENERELIFEKYLNGTIDGESWLSMDLNVDDEVDVFIDRLFCDELKRIKSKLDGLSENRGIMVVKNAMRTIVQKNPELTKTLHRLIQFYFCKYKITAAQLFGASRLPKVSVGERPNSGTLVKEFEENETTVSLIKCPKKFVVMDDVECSKRLGKFKRIFENAMFEPNGIQSDYNYVFDM